LPNKTRADWYISVDFCPRFNTTDQVSFKAGVRVVWLVCAVSCLIGLLVFVPYKLGDTREEIKKQLEQQW
jgi:hypothetical protein